MLCRAIVIWECAGQVAGRGDGQAADGITRARTPAACRWRGRSVA